MKLRIALICTLLFLFGDSARAQGVPGSVTWTGTPHGNNLIWNASTTPSVTYNVWRGTVTGGPYVQVNTAPVTALTFLDPNSNLTVSTTYFYVVTAVSGANQSAYSNQVSVTTPAVFPQNPAPPTNVAGGNQ